MALLNPDLQQYFLLPLALSAVAVQGPSKSYCTPLPWCACPGQGGEAAHPSTPLMLVTPDWTYWTHSRCWSTGSGYCSHTFNPLPDHILGNLTLCNWRWCCAEAYNRERLTCRQWPLKILETLHYLWELQPVHRCQYIDCVNKCSVCELLCGILQGNVGFFFFPTIKVVKH